jgi:hypothetical protein
MSDRFPRCARFAYDAQDPFGSRPDEKPPAGWDAEFWEGVVRRIERRRQEPGSGRPVGSPRRREIGPFVLVGLALVLAAAAAVIVRGGIPAGAPPAPADPAQTIVLVDGSRAPDVAVEWARSGGHRTGYVVLQSIDPQISYVLIDQRLAIQ